MVSAILPSARAARWPACSSIPKRARRRACVYWPTSPRSDDELSQPLLLARRSRLRLPGLQLIERPQGIAPIIFIALGRNRRVEVAVKSEEVAAQFRGGIFKVVLGVLLKQLGVSLVGQLVFAS